MLVQALIRSTLVGRNLAKGALLFRTMIFGRNKRHACDLLA